MKIFYKLYFLIIFIFTFFSISFIYLPHASYAGCLSTENCNELGCSLGSHCRTSSGCCIPDDPPPGGGCTGPASCSASECCVQGACEPKNGSSCGGGGSLSCPSGTQPNPISPFPGCTSSGNCCCALPQNCPLNMACGTTTTVPDGQCGLRTCTGAPCPTTPPTGCSSNPSSCGAGRCCNSNVCGACAATPAPSSPPISNYVNITVYNDPNNVCTAPTNGSGSGPFPYGWWITDPDYLKRVDLRCNGGACTQQFVMFRERGALGTIRVNNNSTISLTNYPAGYRCSDGPGCSPCSKSGVSGDVIDLAPNVVFFITKASTPPPTLDSWWQVKDGEATTNGNLTSKLPAGSLFNIVGLGGFHGLPVFGGSLNTGSGTVSTLLWNANTQGSYTRIFDYSYFENLIPDDVVLNDVSTIATGTGATTYSDGYQWYRVNGNYTINSDINFGTRKVILFVKSGNLTINGKVNLDDNQGFFGTFVNGSISINPALTNTAPNPAIEGIFLSDTTFTTGAGNSLLHLRGSVVSLGNITLDRNLSNNATNAELFEFAPDLISLFPEKLRFKRTKWTEVAP